MLIINLKQGEKIRIGDSILINVSRITKKKMEDGHEALRVVLSFDAPKEIKIERED